MSKIKVNSIEAATGSTITIPSGQTLDISSTTLTLPSTVVTTTGSQTLTNKTIGVSQLTGTLPVANGGTGLTSLGTASQVLRVNSGATALEFGTISSGANAGEVIQVVSTTKSDTFTSTSNTFTDITGLSVTITPSASANKILVMAHVTGNGAVGTSHSFFRMMRDSTVIYAGDTAGVRTSGFLNGIESNNNDTETGTGIFLDSPSSTSSITYKIQGRTHGSNTFYVNRSATDADNEGCGRFTSSITVMEVKG